MTTPERRELETIPLDASGKEAAGIIDRNNQRIRGLIEKEPDVELKEGLLDLIDLGLVIKSLNQ